MKKANRQWTLRLGAVESVRSNVIWDGLVSVEISALAAARDHQQDAADLRQQCQ